MCTEASQREEENNEDVRGAQVQWERTRSEDEQMANPKDVGERTLHGSLGRGHGGARRRGASDMQGVRSVHAVRLQNLRWRLPAADRTLPPRGRGALPSSLGGLR